MGRKNRERVERILSGEEQSIASQSHDLSGFKQGLVRRAEGITRKLVEKTMAPKWMKMSLPQQVGVARKMLRAAGTVNFRANFLKDSNFPSDIVDKLKAGETTEQIRAYFWDCPEWVTFWADLELNKDHFEEILRTAVVKTGASG